MEYDIIALTRCQRRTWQLEQGLDQALVEMPAAGIRPLVVLIPDRPTLDVVNIVHRYKGHPHVIIVRPDAVEGHRWAKKGMEGLNYALDEVDRLGYVANWLWFNDDDEVLGGGWETTLPGLLRSDALALNATSLYIWGKDVDGRDLVNLNQYHYSPIFCRYRRGDRFPTTGISTQVTEEIHKRITRNSFRTKTLPFYLLDYGATTQKEREEMVKRMNAAGKDDLYTRSFLEPGHLVPVTDILTSGIHPIDMAEMQAKRKGIIRE